MRRLLLIAVVLPFAGCTLLNLDGFQLPAADDDPLVCARNCAAALNEGEGFPATCRPWVCAASGECVLDMAMDRCDGADNDCDGAIDEDPAGYVPEFAQPIGYTGNRVAGMSVASDGNAATLTWTDSDSRGFTLVLPRPGDAAPPVVDLSYRTNNVATLASAELTVPSAPDNCWTTSLLGAGQADPAPPQLNKTRCNFVDVAPSRFRDVGFVAAINGVGCSDGQLRIGHTRSGENGVHLTGPSGRSNSWLGVGLTPGGRCSSTRPLECEALRSARNEAAAVCGDCGSGMRCIDGACTRSACTEDSECGGGQCVCAECLSDADLAAAEACGFADISVASTIPSGGSAIGLVAAVSGSAANARCSSANIERDVAIIGTYLDTSGALDFVTTTNEGQPELIGRTRSSAAPGITGLADSFLVAYPPAEGDGLAVHVVTSLPARTPLNPVMCEPVAGPDQMCGSTSPQLPLCLETDCGRDVGVCVSGVRICDGGRGFCDGMVAGRGEICGNRADDDCDGLVDEDAATNPCEPTCVVSAETCNAVDDDCDGMVDEDTGGAACGSDEGACQMGTEICRGGALLCMGEVIPLQNAAGQPIESCTTDAVDMGSPYGVGVDDDCDGRVDETPVGTCGTTCEEDPGMIERCNGRDDDGDCVIDEEPRFNDDDFVNARSTERPIESVRQCLATSELGDVPQMLVPGSLGVGQIDDIVLSAVIEADDTVLVGVAWRETRSPRTAAIGFRMLEFDAECICVSDPMSTCDGTCGERQVRFRSFRSATDPVMVTDSEGPYSAPSIAYQADGFLVPGAMRGGSVVEREGGFFVAWSERMSDEPPIELMFARPMAEHDGQPLNVDCASECAFPLTQAPLAAEPEARFPLLYPAESGIGFVYLDGMTEIVTGSLTCRPPPAMEETD